MTSQENIHSFQRVKLKKYCFEIMYNYITSINIFTKQCLHLVVLQFTFVLNFFCRISILWE